MHPEPSPSPPSRVNRLILWAFLFLLLNGAYLGAFAEPTLPYYGNVLLHLVVGVLFLAGFLAVAWKPIVTRQSSATSRVTAAVAYPLIAGAGATAIYLMLYFAIRPHQPVLYWHVGLAVAGSVMWGTHLWRQAR